MLPESRKWKQPVHLVTYSLINVRVQEYTLCTTLQAPSLSLIQCSSFHSTSDGSETTLSPRDLFLNNEENFHFAREKRKCFEAHCRKRAVCVTLSLPLFARALQMSGYEYKRESKTARPFCS